MSDNGSVDNGNRPENALWFLTEDDQEFEAEGQVSRIPGTVDRVQFSGSCILKDAPDRRIKIKGVATITIADRQQSELEEEAAEPNFEEDQRIAQFDDRLLRRVEGAIDRGHVVVRRGTGPEGEENENERIERVQEAIDRGHVVVRRGSQPEEGEDEDERNQRVQEAINRGHVAVERGAAVEEEEASSDQSSTFGAITVSEEYSTEPEGEEVPQERDYPSQVSPIRRVSTPLNGLGQQNDDQLNFSPIPRRPSLQRAGDDDNDHPDEVSPVRRLNRNVPGGDEDDPLLFSPLPPQMATPRSPVAGAEAPSPDDRAGPSRVRIEIEEAYIPESDTTGKLSTESEEETGSGRSLDVSDGDLVFPFRKVKRHLSEEVDGEFRISHGASVYVASVIENLTKRLLNGAAINANESIHRQIMPHDIERAVKDDTEMNALLKDVIIPKNPPEL